MFCSCRYEPQQYIPHAVRSKNLYNIVIKGMKNTRQPQAKHWRFRKTKL